MRRRLTIVIVEDDDDECALLHDLLERRGYQVIAVATGQQCLDLVARERVDLVITGIQMPGISGVELCRALHARDPRVLVIVLSGAAASVIGTEQDFAFGFMMKPAKLEVLDDMIKRAAALLAQHPAGTTPESDDA